MKPFARIPVCVENQRMNKERSYIMRRFRILFSALLVTAAAAVLLAGCGRDKSSSDSQTNDRGTSGSAGNGEVYADSLEIMKIIWGSVDENERFSSYGGSDLENPVMDAPGNFDVSQTDALTSTLIIPQSLHDKIDNAASLIHMMNANNFTGAAIRINGTDVPAAAEELRKSITGNQFMCGFPEKLVIITTGDYIVYAFGLEDSVNSFKGAAEKMLKDAQVVCDQRME